ncbi:bacteriohemerythrin [Thermogladius sp. 4427co]|uniref:bacteriohemerythrin n=1 Tax=Thermogladius sp. 4427co TaxID=3450718 RepID=UPI003F7B1A7F
MSPHESTKTIKASATPFDTLLELFNIHLAKHIERVSSELFQYILDTEENKYIVVKCNGRTTRFLLLEETIYAEGFDEGFCRGMVDEMYVYNIEMIVDKDSKRLAFGCNKIDRLRAEMMDLISRITRYLIEGDLEKVEESLQLLYEHSVSKHFKTEEELMVKYGYNETYKREYEQHIKAHREYLGVLKDLIDDFRRKDLKTFIIDFLAFYTDYLDYLCRTDKKLVLYLIDKCGLECCSSM